MPKRKKLRQEDIKKNTSVEISHTINKIKENERKYTIILVLIFMICFIVIGYFSLRINNDYVVSKEDLYTNYNTEVILTNQNIMSDQDGLKSKELVYHLDNKNNRLIIYKIILVLDKNNIVDSHYIKYALDDGIVKTLDENMIITKGILEGYQNTDVKVRFWIDNSIPKGKDYYFHGYLEKK